MAHSRPAISADRAAMSDLEEEISALERRLRHGEEQLRRARDGGGDARQLERWEGAWIKLLRQYELMCNRLGRHLTASQAGSSRPSSET
jgi:hypothetical protein